MLFLGLLEGVTEPTNKNAVATTKILPASRNLQPTTTFEIRFSSAMVQKSVVGKLEENTPLVIEPALKGKFTWLSERSGVFTPERPFVMGQEYTVRSRKGLLTRNGATVLGARRLFKTPDFDVIRCGHRPNTLNRTAKPEIPLAFNDDVKFSNAAKHIYFRAKHGQRVPAMVRQMTNKNSWYMSNAPKFGWRDRFNQISKGTERSNPDSPILTRLIVQPEHALSVGEWQLIVGKGLESTDIGVATTKERVFGLGKIEPLSISRIYSKNILYKGRSIEIEFNRPLAEKLQDIDPLQWITVKSARGPARNMASPELDIQVTEKSISLSGDFSLGGYEVTVRAGLPGKDMLSLGSTHKHDVTFNMLEPRVFLPTWSDSQFASGHGKLRLLSLNNWDLRLRIKLVDESYLTGVFDGYNKGYFHDRGWEDGERYSKTGKPLNYNVVPGKTLTDFYTRFNKDNVPEIKKFGGVDDPAELEFNWEKLLGGRKTGVVFVQATSTGTDYRTQTTSQAVIQLTDIGLIWKQSEKEVFAHAFSLSTGKPFADSVVQLMSEEDKVISKGKTNMKGVTRLKNSGEAEWILAKNGNDTHLLPLDGDGEVPLWRFDVTQSWGGPSETNKLLLFTDRGVYKPGEIVHLKGIARDIDGPNINLPKSTKCRLRVYDSRGEEIYNTQKSIKQIGSFDFDVSIPEGSLGAYRMRITLTVPAKVKLPKTKLPLLPSPVPGISPPPGPFASPPPVPDSSALRRNMSAGIKEIIVLERSLYVQVQDYEPAKYKIDLPSKTEIDAGNKAVVSVRAQYYFGKPITKAPVKWVLEGSNAGFWPDEYEDYTFLDSSLDEYDESSNYQLDGEGKLDDDGRITIEPNVQVNPDWPGPVGGLLRVRVTDPTQQTITASGRLVKHSSDFYIGIKRMSRLQYLGQQAKIKVIALHPSGEILKTPVLAKAILKRVEWRSVRMKGAGGTIDYRNEKSLITVSEEAVTIGADGELGTVFVKPKRSGQYLVELHAEDSAGRPVRSAMRFYVPGPQPLAWDYENEAMIELIPDKSRYKPGEEAVFLIKTPISGRALVTVEREKVLRSFQVEFKGNAPAIRVPINTTDAPNVFVSVCLLRGAQESTRKIATAEYRLGYCEIEVEKTDGINVNVSLAKHEYRPGQEVTASVNIIDDAGNAVTDAEVTLYAVDQGVLDLTGYQHPDIEDFFLRAIPLSVDTSTSFPFMLTEDPERTTFGNKGHLIGGGGKSSMAKMRKNFLACAFWDATLRTDAEGNVVAKFKAPDGLTSYKVIAIAHTENSQFGGAQSTFRINKPLMIEAALPRFARKGDIIESRAVIFNESQRERKVIVELKTSENVKVTDGLLRHAISINSRSSKAVIFPLEFQETGGCETEWRVSFSDEPEIGDAIKTSLTIRHAAPLRREILLARIDGTETNLLKTADPQLLAGDGTVTINLSNTRLIELGEASGYLLNYPYGCVEQTSSGLLPWVILGSKRDAIPQLKMPKDRARRAIKYGVQRLASMQTSDGGLAYWPGGRASMLWGSAYGCVALALADREGFRVPVVAMGRLGDFLSRQLRKTKEDYNQYGLNDHCLALYALSLLGRPEPAYHEKLYLKRQHLTDSDRALLALAIHNSNGPRDMARTLLMEQGHKPIYGWFGSAAQSLGVQLLAWSNHDPNAKQIDRLLTKLLSGRKNGHWITTQGNAWAVMALAAYADHVEGKLQPVSGTIVWRGENHPYSLDNESRSVSMTFKQKNEDSESVLIVKNPDNRRLYSNTELSTRTKLKITPRQNRGFSIRREYSRLDENGKLNENVPWRVGDLICVSLYLDVKKPGHYVAIDDPLPAVLEAMNPRFKTQQNAGENKRSWDWMVSHSEIRADRMLYFVDHLRPGQHTFRYLARVRASGKVIAASTKIEEMYHPDRHGVSASRNLASLSAE